MRRREPESPQQERPEVDLKREAWDLAIRRLSVREYSSREMVAYLKRKAIPTEIADQIVSELLERKLLDDRRYARAVTRSQAVRDKGPGYIHAKLKQKGVRIDLDEVRELFSESSERSELELARQMVARRYPHAREDEHELRRAYASLLRRGFSSDVARKVLWGRIEEED